MIHSWVLFHSVQIDILVVLDSCFNYLEICNTETEAWFIDSFEEWRKAKNLSNFILLGHSFGGYVAAKYALKVIALSSWHLNSGRIMMVLFFLFIFNFRF